MTKTITIKTSWSDVTIKEYTILKGILSSEFLEEDVKIERVILLLSNLTKEELSNIKIAEYTKLLDRINFIKDTPKTNIKLSSLRINDKKFDVDLKLSEVVTGQYLMLQNILKDEGEFEDKIKKVLGVFIRPQGVKWGDYDFEEHCEFLYNNLSIEVGYSLAVFFFEYRQQINESYPTLFIKREEDALEEADEEPTQVNNFHSNWGLMIYVDMASEFTRETVPDILKLMPIIDMLYYCLYVVHKRAEEERLLTEYKRKNNIK